LFERLQDRRCGADVNDTCDALKDVIAGLTLRRQVLGLHSAGGQLSPLFRGDKEKELVLVPGQKQINVEKVWRVQLELRVHEQQFMKSGLNLAKKVGAREVAALGDSQMGLANELKAFH
jgi:hypothetical protein